MTWEVTVIFSYRVIITIDGSARVSVKVLRTTCKQIHGYVLWLIIIILFMNIPEGAKLFDPHSNWVTRTLQLRVDRSVSKARSPSKKTRSLQASDASTYTEMVIEIGVPIVSHFQMVIPYYVLLCWFHKWLEEYWRQYPQWQKTGRLSIDQRWKLLFLHLKSSKVLEVLFRPLDVKKHLSIDLILLMKLIKNASSKPYRYCLTQLILWWRIE